MTGVFNVPNTITGYNTPGANLRSALQAVLNNQATNLESRLRVGTTNTTDYSNSTFPKTGSTNLVINYYDYTNIPNRPAMGAPSGYYITPTGLLVASRTAVLNTPANILWTVNN